ncbi:MAG: hypothetical protein WCQ99_12220, partial [Pseudomonadota bacterium]
MKHMAKIFGIFGTACLVFGVITWFSSCDIPPAQDIEDGSQWEKVIAPGFGNDKNYSIVAMAEYKGFLYAMARNEVMGVEVWRSTEGTQWAQVLFPDGEKNGVYGNPWLSCMWGKMIVFNDKLYFGFSSGHQGSVLGSTGVEIWRYDGTIWEPVISDKKDSDEAGTIAEITGCEDKDDDTTAHIIDSSKSWTPDQWKGGVLQITSGEGRFRRFDIVSNTGTALVIQQNEIAGTKEFTLCSSQTIKNAYPVYDYTLGAVKAGDTYEIGIGTDENGFGNYWNKMVTQMVLFDNKLYVSTGLNYEYGAQVWYTEDGDTWSVTQPANSFGNFHTDPNYPDSKKAVSTSIPSLCVSSVSGEPVLYAGGTGASGNLGKCSRMAKLTGAGWELIVDGGVDSNTVGTNENGFGGGMDCTMNNGDFMPWSLAEFNQYLYAGINSLGGARILYTPSGDSADGSWFHVVGGEASIPNGFDGKRNPGNPNYYQNISVNLFPYKGVLYAGMTSLFAPTIGATQSELTGAELWKTSDGTTWLPVTRNGFGDKLAIAYDCFAAFKGNLYVGVNKGSVDGPDGLKPEEGGLIYRQLSNPKTPEPLFTNVAGYETIMVPNGDKTDIYYPVLDSADTMTKFPIALLLQGGRVDKFFYKGFAEHVARYGFIVAVPNHLNSYSMPGFAAEGLFSEAAQIYDYLAFMSAENSNPSSPLAGRVDNATLVMLGHSFGAACTIDAIQNKCQFPFCPEGESFTRPPELKAVALCGINTKPRGKPGDNNIYPTDNMGMPFAIVNGAIDNNAKKDITEISYGLIKDPPKALVFIKGANHYAMCDMNNP